MDNVDSTLRRKPRAGGEEEYWCEGAWDDLMNMANGGFDELQGMMFA